MDEKKKIICVRNDRYRLPVWFCPSCKEHLYVCEVKEYDHCPFCGEALYWGEENNITFKKE